MIKSNFPVLSVSSMYSIFTNVEQEELSGVHKQGLNDGSVVNRFFNYFLDN